MPEKNDFMSRLVAGKKKYEADRGSVKRRRFAVGLHLQGRLLPFDHEGELGLLETFHHHYYQSMGDSSWVFLACPKNAAKWDEPCPFCDAMIAHYKVQGADAIYNSYKRKRKFKVNFQVTNVAVLEDHTLSDTDKGLWEEAIGTVVTLDLPLTLKQKIDEALNDEDLGLSIFNPVDGFDFRIKVTEKKTDSGTMSDYSLSDFARKATKVAEIADNPLENCQDLKEAIRLLVEADAGRIGTSAQSEGLQAGTSAAATTDSVTRGQDEAKDEAQSGKSADTDDGSLMGVFNRYSE